MSVLPSWSNSFPKSSITTTLPNFDLDSTLLSPCINAIVQVTVNVFDYVSTCCRCIIWLETLTQWGTSLNLNLCSMPPLDCPSKSFSLGSKWSCTTRTTKRLSLSLASISPALPISPILPFKNLLDSKTLARVTKGRTRSKPKKMTTCSILKKTRQRRQLGVERWAHQQEDYNNPNSVASSQRVIVAVVCWELSRTLTNFPWPAKNTSNSSSCLSSKLRFLNEA